MRSWFDGRGNCAIAARFARRVVGSRLVALRALSARTVRAFLADRATRADVIPTRHGRGQLASVSSFTLTNVEDDLDNVEDEVLSGE
jgi:hypothetical protein